MNKCIVAFFIFWSGICVADGLSQEAKITYLRVMGEAIDVDLEGENGSWGCDNRAFRLQATHQNYNVLSSLILAANAAQTPIKFWLKSCSGSGHPTIIEATQGNL